eukprot:709174_1
MVTDSRSAQNEMLNFEAPAFTPKSPTTSIMQDPACLYGRREVASENAPDESDYDNPCLTEDERVRRFLWRKLLSMDFESWKIRFAVETRGLRKLPDCVQTIMTLPDPEKDEKKCAATKRSRGRNAKEKRELRDPPGCLMFRSGIRCVHENCFRSYRKKRTFPPCFRQFQQGGCSGKSCEFRHSPGLKKESDKLAEIRRDIMGRLRELFCAPGEFKIDDINAIEDTKGNNGERGRLAVTNLRMIWISSRNPRTNLSIGFSCTMKTDQRTAASKLRGPSSALFVMTKYNKTRFEFIFTSIIHRSPRLFTTIQTVLRAFDTSKLYRELRLRGAILKDKALITLPDEQICEHKMLKVRSSKFGPALVIETSNRSGGYILGFRVDPVDKLENVHKLIRQLHQVYIREPLLGVKFAVEDKPLPTSDLAVPKATEEMDIVEPPDHVDMLASYYAATGKAYDRAPEYNAYLGLAVEGLKDGFTMEKLWTVGSDKK